MGGCACRMLALGDIFAVSTADSSGQASLLTALSSATGAQAERPNVSFFKVVDMSPAASTSLLVDSTRSNITLEVDAAYLFPLYLSGMHANSGMTASVAGHATDGSS